MRPSSAVGALFVVVVAFIISSVSAQPTGFSPYPWVDGAATLSPPTPSTFINTPVAINVTLPESTPAIYVFAVLSSNVIVYWSSTDGATWSSSPQTVTGASTLMNITATQHLGSIYVAWIDRTTPRLLYATSVDGVNWVQGANPISSSASNGPTFGFFPTVGPLPSTYTLFCTFMSSTNQIQWSSFTNNAWSGVTLLPEAMTFPQSAQTTAITNVTGLPGPLLIYNPLNPNVNVNSISKSTNYTLTTYNNYLLQWTTDQITNVSVSNPSSVALSHFISSNGQQVVLTYLDSNWNLNYATTTAWGAFTPWGLITVSNVATPSVSAPSSVIFFLPQAPTASLLVFFMTNNKAINYVMTTSSTTD